MSQQPDGILKGDAIHLLADGLALAYHEARHVRFLTKAGHLPPEGWDAFIDLPRNRVEAWKTLIPRREAASVQTGAKAAAAVFETAFGRSAADLVVLYSNPHWRHAAAVGGHAWRKVVAYVLTLRDAIDSGEPGDLRPACARLVNARHNNGQLRDKIVELNGSVGRDSHPLWRQLVAGA
jgi:hypothetical protein